MTLGQADFPAVEPDIKRRLSLIVFLVLTFTVSSVFWARSFAGVAIDTGWTKWVTAEFGIGLAIISTGDRFLFLAAAGRT